MAKRTFKDLFCERAGCATEEYERQALTRFFYPHARPFLPLLKLVDALPVVEARELIAEIGKAKDSDDFREVIDEYRDKITGRVLVFDPKFRLSSKLMMKWIDVFAKEAAVNLELFDAAIARNAQRVSALNRERKNAA